MEWSISRGDLEHGLRQMVEGKVGWVHASFGTAAAVLDGEKPGSRALYCGLLWGFRFKLDPALFDLGSGAGAAGRAAGSGDAGVFITLFVPQQLGSGIKGVAEVALRVVVHRWEGGRRKGGWEHWRTLDGAPVRMGCSRGWPGALGAAAAGCCRPWRRRRRWRRRWRRGRFFPGGQRAAGAAAAAGGSSDSRAGALVAVATRGQDHRQLDLLQKAVSKCGGVGSP